MTFMRKLLSITGLQKRSKKDIKSEESSEPKKRFGIKKHFRKQKKTQVEDSPSDDSQLQSQQEDSSALIVEELPIEPPSFAARSTISIINDPSTEHSSSTLLTVPDEDRTDHAEACELPDIPAAQEQSDSIPDIKSSTEDETVARQEASINENNGSATLGLHASTFQSLPDNDESIQGNTQPGGRIKPNQPSRSPQSNLDEENKSRSDDQHFAYEEERAFKEVNNTASWELVVNSIEQSYQNETADREEAHEAEIRSLQGELRRANTKINLYQKRVEQLRKVQSANQDCLKTKDETLDNLTSTSQLLQHEKDKLRNKLEILSSDLEKSRQKNASTNSCLQQKEDMFRAVSEERDYLAEHLKQSKSCITTMASDLVKAQDIAIEYHNKIHGSSDHQKGRLDSVADLKKLVSYKDHAIQDLENKAATYSKMLTDLQESNERDQINAKTDISALEMKIRTYQSSSLYYKAAMKRYRTASENIHAFLYKKLMASDFVDAIAYYYDAAIEDNEKLNSQLEERLADISNLRQKITTMEINSRQDKQLLLSKEELMNGLEEQLRSEEEKTCSAELDFALATNDNEKIIQEKDELINSLQSEIDHCRKEVNLFINSRADEGIKAYVSGKEREVKFYKNQCEKLHAEKSDLELWRKMKKDADTRDTEFRYWNEQHEVQLGKRLEEAYEEIASLREKTQQPIYHQDADASIRHEELRKHEAMISSLEEHQQAAEIKAAKYKDLYEMSAEKVTKFTTFGIKLLELLCKIKEGGTTLEEFDLDLNEILSQGEMFFEINEADDGEVEHPTPIQAYDSSLNAPTPACLHHHKPYSATSQSPPPPSPPVHRFPGQNKGKGRAT